MIWSMRSIWGIHCDVVNPRLFELEAAKEMFADIFDIQVSVVDGLIRQHILQFSAERDGIYDLYTTAKRLYPL